MTDILSLDEGYSTTRLLTQEKPQIINTPEDKFETVLFLPEGENRKGEGGLRTKGYFKKSYEDKPLISIITVVFNGEKYLEETIQSVINQTYSNVEYIIIDGGSSDGTLDIIKKYEGKIDYWVSEKDKGIYDAMNKGIDVASGEWINFMNAGDGFYADDVLDKIFILNQYKNKNILYGDVETNYGNFRAIHKAGNLINLNKSMQFSHQSTFFNAKYHKSSKYDLAYKLSADYLNIISIYSREKETFSYLNIPISVVNTEGVSEINIFNSVLERWRAVKQIKNSSFKIDLFYSFSLIKQYIKIKLVPDYSLTKYRNFKYKNKS